MAYFVDAPRDEQAYADAWSRIHAALDQGEGVEAILAAAPDFPALVATRLDTLHQALRGLGLSAPDLSIQGARLVEVGKTVVRLAFLDRAVPGRETVIDMARNGNAFLNGRRYEASLSRVSLSDAEIANTSILRLDIDRAGRNVIVTFMTLDARPARITFHGDLPTEPLVDGTLPKAAVAAFHQRPAGVALSGLADRAIAATEADGASLGLLRRLFSARVRLAHRDRRVLSAIVAEGGASDAASLRDPEAARRLAEALLRRLSAEDAEGRSILVCALVTLGLSVLLAGPLSRSGS